jgi:integrase
MNEEFAWQLIESEANATFKAIWLVAFFGGPRLSELLSLWTCDVLPGECRKHWFPGDIFVDLPLVTIANPWHSKWCGKIGDERTTREQYLLQQYGLYPRPRMVETESGEYRGKATGFKGTRPTNAPCLMRQVYWASEEAAHHFEATIMEVLDTRARMPRAKLHPFLFVNTDPRQPSVQGDMISLSNVRKAFTRAILRIGGTPYRWKQSPHGARHLYKDIIEGLSGGDKGIVQACMGHWSRESQDEYGSLNLQALRHAMAAANRGKRQP